MPVGIDLSLFKPQALSAESIERRNKILFTEQDITDQKAGLAR